MRRVLSALALICWPFPALAHPHIFVETGLRVLVDDAGRLEAVEVTWVYDDFYSMLVMEDLELDDDYDGALTQAEIDVLDGFDMNWVEGFAGDLYVLRDGEPVALGAPEPLETDVANGRIVTRHRRAVDIPAEGAVIQAYDPTYYTAYELDGVTATGDCTAEVEPVDRSAALEEVAKIIRDMNDQLVEVEFPEVGERFADTIRLTCGN